MHGLRNTKFVWEDIQFETQRCLQILLSGQNLPNKVWSWKYNHLRRKWKVNHCFWFYFKCLENQEESWSRSFSECFRSRVFFYNTHRVKSSLLSLELSFRSLLQGRLLSDDSILCDNSKQACRFFKNPLHACHTIWLCASIFQRS